MFFETEENLQVFTERYPLSFLVNSVGFLDVELDTERPEGYFCHHVLWVTRGEGLFNINGDVFYLTAGNGIFLKEGNYVLKPGNAPFKPCVAYSSKLTAPKYNVGMGFNKFLCGLKDVIHISFVHYVEPCVRFFVVERQFVEVLIPLDITGIRHISTFSSSNISWY